MFFWVCVFNFFFEHHIHKQIFNTLCTNLHPIFFQLNLNSIQVACHSIFSLKWNLIFTKLIHFFIN
jgi:hypothetical protein